MEMIIRRFAGAFILISLLLAHYHSPYWLWFTAFVGFNLLQSSFTKFCPLEIILNKVGVGGTCCVDKSLLDRLVRNEDSRVDPGSAHFGDSAPRLRSAAGSPIERSQGSSDRASPGPNRGG